MADKTEMNELESLEFAEAQAKNWRMTVESRRAALVEKLKNC